MAGGHESDVVFAGPVPLLYEQFLVPLLFESYAQDLADVSPLWMTCPRCWRSLPVPVWSAGRWQRSCPQRWPSLRLI